MAVHNVGDDVGRLVAWQFSQLQGGELAALRQRSGMAASAVAKAAGCTPDQYFSWESGLADPTTAQALAIMDFYRTYAPNMGVRTARSQAAAGAAAEAERELQAKARARTEAAW